MTNSPIFEKQLALDVYWKGDDMRTLTGLINGLIGKNYIMFMVNNFLSLLSATIVNNALF